VVSQVVGGTPSYNLQWNPGGSTGSVFNGLTAGTYTLTITDSNSCQEVSSFVLTEPQALSVSVSSNNYVLTAIPSGGIAPFSYSWREQSSNTHLQGGDTYVVSVYGSYYVVVTDANGCEINSTAIAFTATWDCIGGACVDPEDGSGMYSSLSACNTACIASWDCIQNICVDPGTGQGIYSTYNACAASCITTGVEESSVFDVLIYPNPFKEETTVDFGMEIKEATISVVDVYGKQIESYFISNTDQHILKRNNKASGIYFMEIEVGEVKLFTKIIIE
jgi:hypothetical protein